MIRTFCLIASTVLLFLTSCCRSASAQDLAIAHVNVYTSPEASLQQDMTIVMRRGVIVAVTKHGRMPAGVKTLSCDGGFAIAGFWNAHVHFMEPKWNDAAHQPADKLEQQMRNMVTRAGFVTVVDTGSDGENTIALRQRVESGEVRGPRILTAGIPLFPAHALPYYLKTLPPELIAKMAQPADAVEAIAWVDRNHAAGYDIVKLFTGSIVEPDHIVPMSMPVARAAVTEAHRYGQLVFAHPSNLEGTQVAVEAGVDVLAHSPELTSGIDDAMLRQMIAQHMTIVPTLKLFSRDDEIASIRELDYRFHKLGGRLVYGTDTGFLQDYDQGEEFRQLSKAGLSFRDVLAMLTTAPAEVFHLSKSEGKVMQGMRGDLTILAEDPASGIPEAFTRVRATIRGGVVIWSAR